MNTLYFFKADRLNGLRTPTSQIVFLLTADNDFDAKAKGMARISEACRADYSHHVSVEVVCQTPDIVEGFEPL